jgi:hypothetical protein
VRRNAEIRDRLVRGRIIKIADLRFEISKQISESTTAEL